MFVPIAFIFASYFSAARKPHDISKFLFHFSTIGRSSKPQKIVVGPVAAFEAMKMLAPMEVDFME